MIFRPKTLFGVMFVSILLSGPTLAASKANRCAFSSRPIVLFQEGAYNLPDSRILQFWDLSDPGLLWSAEATPPRSYKRFQALVGQLRFKTDPIAALRASPSVNNDLVLSESETWIRPANCLEKLLVGIQNDRVSIAQEPTEFVSIALDHQAGKRLRIYFYSVNRNGIGAMTPLTRQIDKDIEQGWRVNFVLHNHAFHISDPALNGILAPSGPDANFNSNFLESHGLRDARITNGIHTVEIPSRAFDRFRHD